MREDRTGLLETGGSKDNVRTGESIRSHSFLRVSMKAMRQIAVGQSTSLQHCPTPPLVWPYL